MPTQPSQPTSPASVDRLTLSVDSPRGGQPSQQIMPCGCLCTCFEAEASVMCSCIITCNCFEAESSAVIFGCFGSSCFEAE